jgi:elongation factor G
LNIYTKKQSGGQGQFARIIGYMEPLNDDEGLRPQFLNRLVGQNIPPNFVPAIQKGFEDSVAKGPLIGNPIERIRFVLTDGEYHSVDSSEFAFRICTQYAFSQAFFEAGPSLLQPVMNVEIRIPAEYQQSVLASVNKRRGNVTNAVMDGAMATLYANVPLAAMFGYSAELRSVTEGKGEFAMEYLKHDHVVGSDREKIIEKYAKAKKEEEEK